MALKHLLVNLDTTDETAIRCELAIQLAKAHDAHLTGLYVQASRSSHTLSDSVTAGASEQFRQIIAAQRAAQDEAESKVFGRFSKAVSAAGVPFDHHAENDVAGTGAVSHLVRYARTADLVILGKEDDHGGDTAHEVLFSAGVPVIVVPRMPQITVGRHVMIAWNGSRESARAVKDAMPILERAARVTVLCVDQAEQGRNDLPGTEVAAHLRHHGVEATVDNVTRKKQSVGEAIVARIADAGVDLLVMGAWGHSRLREFMLGGVTRSILGGTPVPVLMSH